MWHIFSSGATYLPHLPPAHFLAFNDAHLPLAAHFALAVASPPVVHPVKPTIAKPTSAVNINFFILSPA